MKKIILATFALLGLVSMQAQKNSVLMGSDFSYQKTDNFNASKVNQFTYAPFIAYEIANQWVIGVKTSLGYGEASSKDFTTSVPTQTKDKTFSNRVGGFIRYYKPFSENFGVYADLGAGYQQQKYDETIKDLNTGLVYTDPNTKYREYGYYIDLTPTIYMKIKNNFALNFSLGGLEWNDVSASTASDYDNYQKTRSLDVTLGKAVKIGITKKFTF